MKYRWTPWFTAILLACGLAQAQSLTGRWTGNMSSADDGLPIVVAINQGADGKITGYVQGRSEDGITSGKMEGDKITLEAERPGRGGGVQQVTYTGSLEAGKLKLTLPMGGRGGGPGRGPGGPGGGPGRGSEGAVAGRGYRASPRPRYGRDARASHWSPDAGRSNCSRPGGR